MSAWEQCPVPEDDLGRGLREYQEDFETGSEQLDGTSTTRRPDAVSLDYLRAWSIGPVARSDTSEGLIARAWEVRADNEAGAVYLRRAAANLGEPQSGWLGEEQLFTFTGAPIQEVDLAFDQNGNAIVCAQRSDNEVWLYWFNPVQGMFVFEEIAEGRTPRLLLDDPRNAGDSDLLLFYVADYAGAVEIRTQRELFANVAEIEGAQWVDYVTGAAVELEETEDFFLEDVARAVDYRLHVYGSIRNRETGRYRLVVAETVPYPIPLMETLTGETRLRDLEVVTTIIEPDVDLIAVEAEAHLPSLDIEDLVFIVSNEGPDAFVDTLNLAAEVDLPSLDIEDLIITPNHEPVQLAAEAILTELEIVLSVIVPPQLQDQWTGEVALQSITIEAI